MTEQTNAAAERSAHVVRGVTPPHAGWPVVEVSPGTFRLQAIVAAEAACEAAPATARQANAFADRFAAERNAAWAEVARLRALLRRPSVWAAHAALATAPECDCAVGSTCQRATCCYMGAAVPRNVREAARADGGEA